MLRNWHIALLLAVLAVGVVALNIAPALAGCGTGGC
jgi:hypothetical protein